MPIAHEGIDWGVGPAFDCVLCHIWHDSFCTLGFDRLGASERAAFVVERKYCVEEIDGIFLQKHLFTPFFVTATRNQVEDLKFLSPCLFWMLLFSNGAFEGVAVVAVCCRIDVAGNSVASFFAPQRRCFACFIVVSRGGTRALRGE